PSSAPPNPAGPAYTAPATHGAHVSSETTMSSPGARVTSAPSRRGRADSARESTSWYAPTIPATVSSTVSVGMASVYGQALGGGCAGTDRARGKAGSRGG